MSQSNGMDVDVEHRPTSEEKNPNQAAVKEVIMSYLRQIQDGCGRPDCTNQCASNPSFVRPSSKAEQLQLAIQLARSKATVCPVRKMPQAVASPDVKTTPAVPPSKVSPISSPLTGSPPPRPLNTIEFAELSQLITTARDTKEFAPANRFIGRVFADISALDYAFIQRHSDGSLVDADEITPGIDYGAMDKAFEMMAEEEVLNNVLSTATARLVNAPQFTIVPPPSTHARELRRYLVLLENPIFEDPESYDLFKKVLRAVSSLHSQHHKYLTDWFSRNSHKRLRRLVGRVQTYITVRWYSGSVTLNDVIPAVKTLKLMYDASEHPGYLSITTHMGLSAAASPPPSSTTISSLSSSSSSPVPPVIPPPEATAAMAVDDKASGVEVSVADPTIYSLMRVASSGPAVPASPAALAVPPTHPPSEQMGVVLPTSSLTSSAYAPASSSASSASAPSVSLAPFGAMMSTDVPPDTDVSMKDSSAPSTSTSEEVKVADDSVMEIKSVPMSRSDSYSGWHHSSLVAVDCGEVKLTGAGKSILPFEDFYNDAVNQERDFRDDYKAWRNNGFSFCQYPFLLDPASKSRVLQVDAQYQMVLQFEEAMQTYPLMRQSPYLILQVHRDNLIEDTLQQLQQLRSDLKKPLKVKFVGEEGIDEGGVQKEFFQLIVRELFSAESNYDMFTYDTETHSFWFNKDTLTSNMEFELIGMILGLAIYNSVILDVRFPLVVYKKLMGVTPTFEDLQAVNPSLARGFQTLLEFDGDVENTYCQTFSVQYEVFGEMKTVELKPNGKDLPLTNDNRKEYVKLYTEWMLEKSVNRQFKAFQTGFERVAGGFALKLFRPEELELLICGNPDLDFEALEQATVYEDGFNKNSRTIRNFWTAVHKMSLDEKKKFLAFCTGSDRVPIKGLGNLQFTISKNGPDSERLPTAHTCFNHLLLPDYSTPEKLERYLKLAIENSQGFGLR